MFVRLTGIIGFIGVILASTAGAEGADSKLDAALQARAQQPRGLSRVIVRTTSGTSPSDVIKAVAGMSGRSLSALHGQVGLVADDALQALAARADVLSISLDRRVRGTLERTTATVGASWIREELGVDGAGVGVAIIDSGVANWHDDLGADRVVHFADFVTHLPQPYDDYGHGTHVAGIIAGSGFDSGGARRGIAPGANLIVLKVLDGAGDGYISNVIAAIDYVIEHRERFNIRVLNLSVAAGVYESYSSDPFTLAARRAVDAGIVVVTAAGNLGRNESGQIQRGGVTAPGNAPWVLTVGATNHQRTVARGDDTLASFSSRGPTNVDGAFKPDVVAPGVGIESLASAGSTIFNVNPDARLSGTIETATAPYLSMTGTSMAAPVVAGTVALMLQVNPELTPNLVKAILQYTAERRPRLETTAQGAGFLNARGAVQLSAALLTDAPVSIRDDGFAPWSRQVIWGNRRVRGANLSRRTNAWRDDVEWGAVSTPDGEPIVVGVAASAGGGEDEIDEPQIEASNAVFSASSETRDIGRWAASLARMDTRGFLAIPPEERRRSRRDAHDAERGDGA